MIDPINCKVAPSAASPAYGGLGCNDCRCASVKSEDFIMLSETQESMRAKISWFPIRTRNRANRFGAVEVSFIAGCSMWKGRRQLPWLPRPASFPDYCFVELKLASFLD